ncbi:hypothetical protein [Stenotrophomonas sp. SY1]|uniref:hypothetical protein n=1 Tax=Stenotrophomonas sp. SY1 TaxID=477235 RepID=UPI001E3F3DE6|nr:hypothetical protein [Stenotrophomonas sp. SY1]MCD9088643.1 hypothetical protein [Stenotrophomonas sp. SY1]
MVLRWALAFFAVLGGFSVAGVLGSLATGFAGFWHLPGAGFSAALAVVVVAYLAAPSHKLRAAIAALVFGAIAAWLLLEPSFYPENYGDRGAYEPTHLPIIATYTGGLLGLLVAAIIGRWAGPNNSFKPKPHSRSA